MPEYRFVSVKPTAKDDAKRLAKVLASVRVIKTPNAYKLLIEKGGTTFIFSSETKNYLDDKKIKSLFSYELQGAYRNP